MFVYRRPPETVSPTVCDDHFVAATICTVLIRDLEDGEDRARLCRGAYEMLLKDLGTSCRLHNMMSWLDFIASGGSMLKKKHPVASWENN